MLAPGRNLPCVRQFKNMIHLNLLKPAISWPGGKRRLVKHIVPQIPAHTCYVEPFAGGLAVLCAKPRSKVEVINDLHDDLINFYRCVRFHAAALLEELRMALRSRTEFKDYLTQPGITDIQRATRWFFRNRSCFGSNVRSFGTSALTTAVAVNGWNESILKLKERLDRVTIESVDWKRCVTLYDRPTTFFFIDPPYTTGDCGTYSPWTIAEVKEMRAVLDSLKGSWMVTLDDSEGNREVFRGCRVKGIDRAQGINNRPGSAVGRRYREIIVTP